MKFVRILLALFVLLFEFNSIQAQTVSGTFVYSNDTAQTKFVSFNTYSYRVTYNNAPLYRIDSILIDNIYNGYDSMFGITLNGLGDGITKLLTIKFLDSNSYQINTNVVNGSITKSILVAAGSNYTVTYSRISNNYFLDSIIVDGQKVTTDSVSSYTFTNITKLDHNISVYYNTRITANVIYSNDTSTVRIVKFNYGQYRLMYNTPNNYYLDSIFYNNSFAGLDSLTGYTLNNIRSRSYNYFSTKYILASQAARVFTKVVNGQISSNQVLPLGSAIRITFNPTQYYKLDSIVVDGIQTSLDSVSGYTFKNILSDHTIQVYYSLIPFLNVKTKVTNGVITASDSIRQGNNILITFSPNLNYKLDSIVVDGNIISLSIIGPNVSFTFNNIQTNHTIYVYYSIKPEFNINANVVNGNITPSLATPVFSNVRIEYSPVTANYLLDSVVINNINIGKDSVSGYTFKNIQQNNSIRVYYNTYLTSTVIYTNDTARGTLVKFVNKSFRVNYAIPNGFGLDSIYADNLFVGKDSVTGFTFKNIALGSKHFLTNIFNPTNSVKITTYILNGQISPKTYQALGSNYRVTYNTLNGYVLDSLVVDGVQISRDSISGYTFTNLQTSHTINVYFNLKLNGTIVYSTDTAQTRFVKFNGGYFRVTYNTPNTYRLDNVIADGQNYGPDSTNGFTFNNIQFLIDRYLTVIFSNSPSIKITTQVFNGQISATQSISRNSNLRVTYTPNTNYKLDSIIVNGVNIGKDSFSGYTFNNINFSQTIRVYYSPVLVTTFSINTQVFNGQISATQSVSRNSNLRVTYTPNTNYKLDSILVNGINIGKDSFRGYTFYNINFSQTIRVYYSPILVTTYTISTLALNGQITPTQSVNINSNFRVTYSPNTNYKLDSIIVNGNNIGNDSTTSYTFNNIQSNVSIVVYYNSIKYSISTQVYNGQISPTQSVNIGSNFRVTYSPDTNFKLDSIIVNGNNIGKDSTIGFTFNNIQSNWSILVYFGHTDTTLLTISTQAFNGLISASQTITKSSNFRVTYTPNANYKLDSIVVNRINVGKDSVTGYTFKNIQFNQTIKVYYSPIIFYISTQVFNGQISAPQSRIKSSNYRVTYTSNTNFKLDSIVVNGINIGKDSMTSYTFNNIQSNQSIKVYYSPILYTISTTVVNGIISGSTTVIAGSSYRVTFMPNTNYKLDLIVVNGVNIGKDSFMGITFNKILSNIDIVVYFSPIGSTIYTISTQVFNGQISASTTVNPGSSYRVTYLPSIGYSLDSIVINNNKITSDSMVGYTFNNILSDNTIKVYYSYSIQNYLRNYNLVVNNLACRGNKDGKLYIRTQINSTYSYIVTNSLNIDTIKKTFCCNLDTINNLAAGNYKICFTNPQSIFFNQCFNFTIKQPDSLQLFTIKNNGENFITVQLSGSEKYNILWNQQLIQTNQQVITLPLNKGINKLDVSTDLNCQGRITQDFTEFDGSTLYPNPTFGNTNIVIGGSEKEVDIMVLNSNGDILFNRPIIVPDNRVYNLDVKDYTSGTYLIKIQAKNYSAILKLVKY